MSTAPPPPRVSARLGIPELARALAGPVLTPADAGFVDEVAGFNLTVAPAPVAVVGASSSGDVATAIRHAQNAELRVGVRATGHGPSGGDDQYLTVTTHRMTRVDVDPARRRARVEAGARWRDVLAATAPHGLTGAVGSSSAVGVVGYTLGGGLSPFGRTVGYAADHVRSLDVVTADGLLRRVDRLDEPDLFWALRGGRDGLGIVTSMEFDLFDIGSFHGGGMFFDSALAHVVLHLWRQWAPTLPDDAGTSIALLRLPPDPHLPPVLQGRTVVHLRFTFLGDDSTGDALLAPMRAAGPTLLDTVGRTPIPALDGVHMDPVGPMAVLDASATTESLPADAVDAVLAVAGPEVDSPLATVEIRLLGGRLDCPQGPSDSVIGRGSAFNVFTAGVCAGPLGELAAVHTSAVVDAVAPWSDGALLNFAGRLGAAQRNQLWPDDERARLAAIRSAYDPHGVLRPAR
ncbi:FAD/FMN-containing dehydrogenase [Dietzia sp. 2505]|uniref:FAD-binding oxidoreductase n=1 Tax=Dietzia sp. 2505 TaxID=3156457 RepID=UPI00339345DD